MFNQTKTNNRTNQKISMTYVQYVMFNQTKINNRTNQKISMTYIQYVMFNQRKILQSCCSDLNSMSNCYLKAHIHSLNTFLRLLALKY